MNKCELYELVDYKIDLVEGLCEQDLDFLADAIQIQQHKIMQRKLQRAGIGTKIKLEQENFTYWFSYILVYNPNHGDCIFANLAECQRLLDTVHNLPPVEAYVRWSKKVVPIESPTYAYNDAIRDVREERLWLKQQYTQGEIDSQMYSEFYVAARQYLEFVELG